MNWKEYLLITFPGISMNYKKTNNDTILANYKLNQVIKSHSNHQSPVSFIFIAETIAQLFVR